MLKGFPGGSVVKNPPAKAGDMGSIPGLGRSPGEGNGNSLQYSCLGNPMARGDLQATVHEVTKSWTQLSTHTHTHRSGSYACQQICLLVPLTIQNGIIFKRNDKQLFSLDRKDSILFYFTLN